MKLVNCIIITLFIVTACASPNSTSSSTSTNIKNSYPSDDKKNAEWATSKSDVYVCRVGTTIDGSNWDTSVSWFKANANEAQSRGLTLKGCNNLTKKNKEMISTEEIISSGTGDEDISIIGSGS
tara:strand:- start:673 stop:1044 length:372 start_codon:yes stop_codon:yes gene_type:complete